MSRFRLVVLVAGAAFVATPAAALTGDTYVYVHANDPNPQVYGFALDTNGFLTSLEGSPFSEPGGAGDCSGFCNALAYASGPAALVTANGGGVASLAVATDGSLSPVAGAPFAFSVSELGTSVASVEVGGRTFVYASQYFADAIDGFEMALDGSLSRLPGMPLTSVVSVGVVAGGGDRLFVCDENHHRLRTYKVGTDGSLTASASKPTKVPGKGPIYSVTTNAAGTLLFTGEWKKGRTIFAFRADAVTGKLAKPRGFGLKVRDADGGISVSSTGLLAVFASKGPKDAQIVRVSADGKFKRLGGAQASGLTHVTAHAFSPDGRFLIASDGGLGQTRSYAVDGTTGKLTQVDSETTATAASLNGMTTLQR